MHANNHSAQNLLHWVTGLVLLSLTLAACGASNTTALGILDTAAPSPAAGSCLIGKWQITDFTSYFDSVGSTITSSSKSDVTVTNKGTTGDAWFTFNSDGTAEVSGDNFTQSFEMTASGLDIPASVTINGASQAKYTVSADQITFTDQQAGDMKVSVTVMGNTTDATDVFLGQAGTTEQYLYTCTDANTLTLKVVTAKLDFAPITLTRVP
ncbi:MAG: hypothetical protein ABSA51_01275 [Anaerolineaceae bacterium]|jgi:hypothetical protein